MRTERSNYWRKYMTISYARAIPWICWSTIYPHCSGRRCPVEIKRAGKASFRCNWVHVRSVCPLLCCTRLLAGLISCSLDWGWTRFCIACTSTIVNRLLRILGSEKISILYEQWIECAGHWAESSLLQQLRYEKRHRRVGARKWLTYAELVLKYGNADCAYKICESKRRDPELAKEQIRSHPDCPGDSDSLFQFSAV